VAKALQVKIDEIFSFEDEESEAGD
jgi:hypothetical protein